ncbi:MAG: DUF4097 family beta strand repeat protein [Acholeplasmatales bacterium]|nr:DUF4097 family beta strand repeat protein [Acholeplasmatales bacterium]
MRKFAKFVIIISILLLISGAGLTVFAYKRNEFKNTGGNEVIKNYDFEENIENINIDVETTDVIIKYVEGTKCKIECIEKEKVYHSVAVKDNVLTVNQNDTRKWYQKYIFNFDFRFNYKVTISLPKATCNNLVIKTSTGDVKLESGLTYNDVKINGSTGDVVISDTNMKSLNVETSTGNFTLKNAKIDGDIIYNSSTGDVKLEKVNSNNITLKTSTGDVTFNETIAKENIEIKSSTGDVSFTDSDANTLNIATSTGDVEGTLLTEKTFHTETSNGYVKVPQGTTGGSCTIKTSTGDIIISVSK